MSTLLDIKKCPMNCNVRVILEGGREVIARPAYVDTHGPRQWFLSTPDGTRGERVFPIYWRELVE